jgi:hypothetical protein
MRTARHASAAPIPLCQEVLMHKLKLDPDMLAVESFATDEAEDAATGTIRGHSFVTVNPYQACGSDEPSINCMDTDYHVYTCGNSCVNMCFQTGTAPTCID